MNSLGESDELEDDFIRQSMGFRSIESRSHALPRIIS